MDWLVALVALFSLEGEQARFEAPADLELIDAKSLLKAARQRRPNRLNAEQVASSFQMCKSRSGLKYLSTEFKIHKQAASAHLNRSGIALLLRRQGDLAFLETSNSDRPPGQNSDNITAPDGNYLAA